MEKPSIALRHPSPGARLTLSINVDPSTAPQPQHINLSHPLPGSLSIHGAAVSLGVKGTLGPSSCLPTSEAGRSRGTLSPSCSKLDFSRIPDGALSISSAPATTALRQTSSHSSLGPPKGGGQGGQSQGSSTHVTSLSLPLKGLAQVPLTPQYDRRPTRHKNERSSSFQEPPSGSRRRSMSSPSLKVTPPTPRLDASANRRARGLKVLGRQRSVNVNPASLIDQ